MTEQTPGAVRTLILLRHAKAEREAGVADIDRPLTDRGWADARAAGLWLARQGGRPDQVLCSPSRRTRQTWEGVGQGIAQVSATSVESEPAIWYEPTIYHGTAGRLWELLRQVTPETRTLLLIGHNPTVSELSELLDPAHAVTDGLRTCAIAVHHVDGDWARLRPGTAPIAQQHTARGE